MLNDFYRGQAWRALRNRLMIERVDGNGVLLCAYCHKPIVKSSACIGHHRIPLTVDNVNDWNIALNPDNIELVHARCHNYIHEKLGLIQQKVYIVYGAPCSGKSTHVQANKGDNDLILDLDNIWQALSGGKRYEKAEALKPVVFSVRDTIYNAIQYRNGNWRTAWVIGTLPFNVDRELLAKRLGAEIIFIDARKELCFERLENDTARERTRAEWEQYITEWFDDYQQGADDYVIESETETKNIIF